MAALGCRIALTAALAVAGLLAGGSASLHGAQPQAAILAADLDSDLDGYLDSEDNCPAVFNPDQEDADNDGVGNTCDQTPGIAANESWLVLYLRDQEGRPVSGACFKLSEYRGAALVGETEDCTDASTDTAGYIFSALGPGNGDREELVATTAPPGCQAGSPSSLTHRFTGGAWQVATVRFSCGKSFTDTFTKTGQSTEHSVTLAPKTTGVEIRVAWTDAGNRFAAEGFRIIRGKKVVAAGKPSPRALAITIKLKPAKLRITKLRITTTRTSTSSTTRVDNVKPGTLTFRVRSRKVVRPTKVSTRVVQVR